MLWNFSKPQRCLQNYFAVKKSREILNVSLRGIYSVSLKISTARRENVRFLFKEALAEALYSYLPNHSQLYGGTSFSSQLEKAAKEAKINISWSKPKQTFRQNYSQGFQYSKGAGKFFTHQYNKNQRGRSNFNNRNNNYKNYNNRNNNRNNYTPNTQNKTNQGRQGQK